MDDAQIEEAQFEVASLSPVETIRHSTAHLMASAVTELYPGTRFAIGPHIEHGFYYDMELPEGTSVGEDDLERIEERMREIAKGNHKFLQYDLPRDEALAWADANDEPYKRELIEGWPDAREISFYKHGDFVDMCAGPHVNYSSKLKHFKLTHVAGAYWRGDEKNKMLTRIYGLAFESKEELAAHLELLEEARKRDHRRLGKELDLFTITQDHGAGLVLWLPNGAFIRKQVEDFWREAHLAHDYNLVYSPHIAPLTLWNKSGHTQNYAESMFSPMEVEGQDYQLKPMNCPFHIGIFDHTRRSYRELPVRYAELGTVYRYERSGALHGLMRVRGFTQDDAHIFCTREQLAGELAHCLEIAQLMYRTFGFPEYEVELSVRDPNNKDKYQGDDDVWELAESTLASVLDTQGVVYKRIEGEAAFYGPKIDVKVVDAIGRRWQLTTVQLDFNLPERFELTYVGSDNEMHRPIMVHRALLGSIERFIGILIEHHAGDFPVWLAPVQARILPVSEKFFEYAEGVRDQLKARGLRVEIDATDEKLGYKIRRSELDKIPYALIVGKREVESVAVGVRKRHEGDLGAMDVNAFGARLAAEVESRA